MGEIETLMAFDSAARPVGRAAAQAAEPQRVDVSILIVTWNSARWIERCLASIPAACEGLAYEVVVFDNASADQTAARAKGVRLVLSPSNQGFAGGMNRAFATSRGRHVFLLNPDCELAPRAITTLYDFLESHPEAAVAAPLLEDESGDSQREFQLRRLPTLGSLVAEVFAAGLLFPSLTARYRYRHLDLERPQRVEQPAGAALLVRRETFEEVGPLDEQFAPAWFEDVDYCRRLAAAGKEVWVVPRAMARHFGGSSLQVLSFGEFKSVWYRNMWRYARKWLTEGESEALRWAIIVAMALRCVATILGIAHRELDRATVLKAYRDVLEKAFHRWGDSSRSS